MSVHTRQSTAEATHNGVLEVSDLRTERVQRYAREADDVYFERKGGRTFLVADR
jgi:hypothetical protein